jgi:hypothetical protein
VVALAAGLGHPLVEPDADARRQVVLAIDRLVRDPEQAHVLDHLAELEPAVREQRGVLRASASFAPRISTTSRPASWPTVTPRRAALRSKLVASYAAGGR